jgi:archaellum component FlaC
MKLDDQVKENTKKIEQISIDIAQIKDNHLHHIQLDIDELKASLREQNATLLKILTILADK